MRIVFSLMVAAALVLTSCSPVPKTTESMKVLEAEVQETIVLFEKEDPGIRRFFEQSAGYAVLPKVFKGALWIGGAYGKGLVYQNEKLIGYCNMSQATLGFSFGGDFLREIIFFRTQADLDRFKSGEYTFSAQATAGGLTAAQAAKADYKDGMAVFCYGRFRADGRRFHRRPEIRVCAAPQSLTPTDFVQNKTQCRF